MHTVYKLVFPNNKVYIGYTSRSVKERFYEHCVKNKYAVRSAIDKYGRQNVEIKILGEYDNAEEALINEKLFITEHKSTSKRYGYNLVEGGNIPPKLAVGIKVRNWLSLKKYCRTGLNLVKLLKQKLLQ